MALCATSARSCASCTELEQSIAQPVMRAAITSEWSPKIDSACVANARAATWNTVGVSSPAILNMLGIIRSRPCDAVNVVVSAPVCSAPWTAPAAPPFALHLNDVRNVAPDVLPALGRPLIGQLAHRRRGRDWIDRADLVHAVRDRGGGLVAIECFHVCARHCRCSLDPSFMDPYDGGVAFGSGTMVIAPQGHWS